MFRITQGERNKGFNMAKLFLSNTLTGKKEEFKSIKPNNVKMYVCGVTPYDEAHIGHGRCYVAFDLLYRLLRFLGYDVTYVRNLTDIDDKILKKAYELYGDSSRFNDVTKPMIASYHDDMHKLNTIPPDYEPRVTGNIDEIITFIQGLIDAGKAYQSDGDVYFSLKSFPEYGKLSKHDISDLRAGERVQVSELKRDPLDFALWKSEKEGTFYKSPWGWGRPGWHIECSAMSEKHLGKTIDIHAGGQDLIFPHHENEIAQSEALHGVPFANYWVHNGFVRINKEKMSKSLGNFFTLKQIFEQFDPIVLRYYLLSHHYKMPIDFSFDDLQSAQKSYQRLIRFFDDVDCTQDQLKVKEGQSEVVNKMLEFLADDMNTPGMFGVLFENLDNLKENQDELCKVKGFLQKVLGLPLIPLPEKVMHMTPEIEALIKEREDARAAKDWAKADAIRDKLNKMGVDIQDKRIK